MIKFKIIRFFLFAIIINIIISTSIHTQEHTTGNFIFKNWNVNNGLPLNELSDIKCDKNNFIWVSSYNGLSKFDGEVFKNFTYRTSNNIKSNFILEIFPDEEDNLCFTTLGEGILRIKKDKIETVKKDSFHIKTKLRAPIFIDKNKILYFKRNNLCIFMNNKEKILKKEIKEAVKIVQHKDKIWIFSKKRLLIFDKNMIEEQEPTIIKQDKNIYKVKKENGRFFIVSGENKRLKEISLNNQGYDIIKEFDINNIDEFLIKKNNKEIVIISNLNFYIMDNNGQIIKKEELPEKINAEKMCEDNFSNIWITSNKNGLYKISEGFVHNIIINGHKEYMPVYALFNDNQGSIWFSLANKNTIGQMDKSKEIKYYKTKTKTITTISKILDNELILSGLYTNFIEILNIKDKKSKLIPIPQKNITIRTIKKINNKIFMGAVKGLLVLDEKYNLTPVMYDKLYKYRISFITEKQDNQLFLATMYGKILLLDLSKKTIKEIMNAETPFSYLHYNKDEDTLWTASFQNGIYIIRNNKTYNINKDQGLCSDVIYSIKEDKKNRVWFSSIHGIFSVDKDEIEMFINKKTSAITPFHYGIEEGAYSNNCLGGNINEAVVLGHNKESLCYPSDKGIIIVNINKKIKIPKIKLLTKYILVDGKRKNLKQNILQKNQSISLHFSCPNYPLSKKIIFRYRLTGVDKKWTYTKNKYTSVYTNLKSGKYKFILQASTNNKRWDNYNSVALKNFYFEVERNIFKELFTTLILPTLIIIIFSIFYYIKTILYKRSKKRLNNMIEEKTIELIETNIELTKIAGKKRDLVYRLTHDFNNKLQIISGNAQLMERIEDHGQIKNKAQLIYSISVNLRDIIGDILQNFKDEPEKEVNNNSLRKKINLGNLVTYNCKLFSIDITKKIITLKSEIDKDCFIYANKTKVGEILDNLISNAIKFTPIKGNIEVKVYKENNKCYFFIKDNGPGFTEKDKENLYEKFSKINNQPTNNERKTGLGLYLTKNMVNEENAKIELHSESGKGSTFIVTFDQFIHIQI